MTKYIYFSFFALLLLIVACSKGPNDGVPAYIKVDNVSLVTSAGQGTDAHLISSLWLESEGEDVGVYEMPVNAPALVSGNRQVIVNAGVYIKGDFLNREIYPMYQPYIVDVDLVAGETVTLNPVFEYQDAAEFAMIEDFENGNAFGTLDRTDLTDSNNIEGKALHIHLDNTTTLLKGITNTSVLIPEDKRVYIEMQFKGDVDFALGVESIVNGSVLQSGYIDRFFADEEWYKIYYDITFLLNGLNATSFNFFVEASKLSTVTTSDLYIDNFKIVML